MKRKIESYNIENRKKTIRRIIAAVLVAAMAVPAAGSLRSFANENEPTLPENSVPLETLEAAQGTAAGTISIYQYAKENPKLKLKDASVEFAGGETVVQDGYIPENIPEYQVDDTKFDVERTYVEAGFVEKYEGAVINDIPTIITGLYYYGNKWYYTSEETNINGVAVGYELPQNSEVRFYYRANADTKHKVNVSYKEKNDTGDPWEATDDVKKQWKLNYTANQDAKAGDIVTMTVVLPSKYSYGLIDITGTKVAGKYALTREENQGEKPPTDYKVISPQESGVEGVYEISFEMPNQDVNVTFTGKNWSTDSSVYFGVFTNEEYDAQPGMYGLTRMFTTQVGSKKTNPLKYIPRSSTGDGRFCNKPEKLSLNNSSYVDASANPGGVTTGYDPTIDEMPGAPYMAIETYENKRVTNSPTVTEDVLMWANHTGTEQKRVRPAVYVGSDAKGGQVWSNKNNEKLARIPSGRFKPGETVKFRIETARGLKYSTNIEWQYYPGNVSVDIYMGSDQYETKNYVRETYELPSKTGESKTYTHPMGGTVKITCAADPSTTNSKLTDDYGVDKSFNLLDQYNYFGSGVKAFKYDVEVIGVAQPFKVMYNSYRSSQWYKMIGEVTNVISNPHVKGEIQGNDGQMQIDGSYIKYLMGQTAQGATYKSAPLATGYQFYQVQKNQVEIGIKPKEGYSLPTFTIANPNSMESIGQIVMTTKPGGIANVDSKGRYVFYWQNWKDGDNKTDPDNPMPIISARSQLITFPVKYYDYNGSDVFSNGIVATLSHEGVIRYAVGHYYPETDSGKYFIGYTLEVRQGADGGNDKYITNIVQTSDGVKAVNKNDNNAEVNGNLWQKGDLINVHEIYEAINSAGYLKQGLTEYQLALVPVQDANQDDIVPITVEKKIQTKVFDGKYADGQYPNEDDNFSTEQITISAKKGSNIIVTGGGEF